VLPKTRAADALPEAEDCYAFMSTTSIREIGERVGIWQMQGDQEGFLLRLDDGRRGDHVDLVLLNPMLAFSAERAARLNGRANAAPRPIAAVRVGALGSQVVMLARMGYAPWALIDPDILLPHNLARHALTGFAVGHAKSDSLAYLITDMLGDQQAAQSLPVDVLHPGARDEELIAALSNASTILDMSASVAVARCLAERQDSKARRISIFLNPSATDLVMLAEDTERRLTLDLLELQYYRLVRHDDRLEHHLHVDGQPRRVGHSCRDISVTLPEDLVALHAANGSRTLRRILESPAARITIWQTDPVTGAVTVIDAEPQEVVLQQLGGWILCIDRSLETQLEELRGARLPNETGGVLLGTIDCERKRIIVVDLIPSPPDSVEWPTVYIRGCRDLRQLVGQCEARTAGWLTYVGEWHSHPAGVPARPSAADRQVLTWLRDERSIDGFPAIMAIVGDQGCAWYLDEA
jgi:integrative and conjugative element protein (TIGR02256 family)